MQAPTTSSVAQPKKTEVEVDAEKLLSALQHDRVGDVKSFVDKIKVSIPLIVCSIQLRNFVDPKDNLCHFLFRNPFSLIR